MLCAKPSKSDIGRPVHSDSIRRTVAAPEGEKPNKAPEPTTFAVTSRAILRSCEMKHPNLNRGAARAAPAKVVAHL
jgi:hypothetical protein